jgi:hypothetical protein
MITPSWSPRRLHTLTDAQISGLAGVLIDCVEGGASVSFMHPLSPDRAEAFWRRAAQGVAAGERALLVAEDARGLCGTVQLVLDTVTGGEAERLYQRLGWQRVGAIPGYALMPRGGLCSTTVYYRDLSD